MLPFERPKLRPILFLLLILFGISLAVVCEVTIPKYVTPSLGDFVVHMILSILFFITLRILYVSISLPLVLKHCPVIEGDQMTALKISHNIYVMVTHTIFGLWCVNILIHRPWFCSYSGVWEFFPDQKQERIEIVLYILKVGYHTTSLGLIAYEPHRDDYVLTIIHHVVTLFLILCSFQLNCVRIGLMVLMYHDLTDGAVSFPKICNYLRRKNMAIVAVIFMIVLWATFRLYLFALLIIHSVVDYRYFINALSQWGCTASLSILWAMHLFWFYLMLQIVKSVVVSKGRSIEDVSEPGVGIAGDERKSDIESGELSIQDTDTACPETETGGASKEKSKVLIEAVEMSAVDHEQEERQRLTAFAH